MFGEVCKGFDVVKSIAKYGDKYTGKPIQEVKIMQCGILKPEESKPKEKPIDLSWLLKTPTPIECGATIVEKEIIEGSSDSRIAARLVLKLDDPEF